MQSYLEAGKFVTTHGIMGELKFEIWCDGVEFLKKFKTLYFTQDGKKSFTVVSVRVNGRMGLMRVEGVNNIDEARAYVGKAFYFARSDVKLPKGVYFRSDLIGCEVKDANTNAIYGVITKIDCPGPQEIYTVKSQNGKEYYFPAVPAFLKERNPEQGYVLVEPIPGLFDDAVVSEQAKLEQNNAQNNEEG